MAPNPWLVPITGIRRSPGVRRREQRRGPIGELRVAGTVVAAQAEADADLLLDVIDGGIEVSGAIEAPWSAECRRCLRPITGRLHAEVRELYRPPHLVSAADPDDDTYPLVGEQLDLAPLVRDALLLDLPLAPLCRTDCAGLCPSCGAVSDDGGCDCGPVATDGRWSVLDTLRPNGRG